MELLHVQVQTYFLLRKLRAKLCRGKQSVEEEEKTTEQLTPPSTALDRGDQFPLTEYGWLSGTITENKASGGGSMLKRMAFVLGHKFLVIASADTSVSPAMATVRVAIPLHYMQAFIDQRSQHVLHLQVWSVKPVPFAV